MKETFKFNILFTSVFLILVISSINPSTNSISNSISHFNPNTLQDDTDYFVPSIDPATPIISSSAENYFGSPNQILPRQRFNRDVDMQISSTSINYTSSVAINITGDAEFDAYGFPGNGTLEDPYRISGLNITTYELDGIALYNTTRNFFIENNLIQGLNISSAILTHGIKLNITQNGNIRNNIISRVDQAIILEQSNVDFINSNIISKSSGLFESQPPEELCPFGNFFTPFCEMKLRGQFGIFLLNSAATDITNNTITEIYNLGNPSGPTQGISLVDSSVTSIENNYLETLHAQTDINRFFFTFPPESNVLGIFIDSRTKSMNIDKIKNNTIVGIASDGSNSLSEIFRPSGILIYLEDVTIRRIELNLIQNVENGLTIYANDDTQNLKTITIQQNVISGANYGSLIIVRGNLGPVSFVNNQFSDNFAGINIQGQRFNNEFGSTSRRAELEIKNNDFFLNNYGVRIRLMTNDPGFGYLSIDTNNFINNTAYGIKVDAYLLQNQEITKNNFYNNFPGQTSEIFDNTINTKYRYNYIDLFAKIDDDGNEIIDTGYPIASFVSTTIKDPYPVVQPNPANISFLPNSSITSPINEGVFDTYIQHNITISWIQDVGYSGETITYDIYYKLKTASTWTLLIEDSTEKSYFWSIAELPLGEYEIQVFSKEVSGFQQESSITSFSLTNSEPTNTESTNQNTSTNKSDIKVVEVVEYQPIPKIDLFLPLLVIPVIAMIGYLVYSYRKFYK